MKKVLWMIAGNSFMAVWALVVGIWYIYDTFKRDDPEFVLGLINDRKKDKNMALTTQINGKRITDVIGDSPLPLASTMKIIVAIECAQQAAAGTIHPDQQVSFERVGEILCTTNGWGAHEAWIDSLEDKEQVSVSEIANGMMTLVQMQIQII
ncbi:serine hydrolase [Siminovitchia sediminis]|uniref:Serine hydrolase n=1 Tax=Siminovitchia sediminis TaxID=1274353 RepID=A0ABW4KEW1_9BACI